MRLGKNSKRSSRGWSRADEYQRPLYISEETIIGQVSPDLISSHFAPRIRRIADQQLEDYAGLLLEYEDSLRREATADTEATTATMGAEGEPIVEERNQSLNHPPQPLFHSRFIIDEFTHAMTETSDYFFGTKPTEGGNWRIHANAAKFERILDEKYGVFRPFITNHPEIERFIRNVQRKYATGYFSPIRQGNPPIPRSTAIVILFMMNRGGISWQVVLLSALFFLVGLKPWALVAVIVLVRTFFVRRKNRPIANMPRVIPAVKPYYVLDGVEPTVKHKHDLLLKPIGHTLKDGDAIDTALYDTIILGSGPPALFSASLLSRAGRRVIVLSERADASGCLTLNSPLKKKLSNSDASLQDIAFDVDASNVPKLSGQQQLMAPALATTTDYQGGIRFAKIGSVHDGHAFEILSIPGVGADQADQEIPFVLKADGGVQSLMQDTAALLGDGWPEPDGSVGNSSVGSYVAACTSMNSSAGQFYLSKLLPDSINDLQSKPVYGEGAVRYASSFLDSCFPLNAHVRSLMAGLGMKGENLKPGDTSMAPHITHVSAAISGQGMHYPVGGPRALGKAFANVVERNGGRVLTSVRVTELLFDEDKSVETRNVTKPDEGPPPPRCVGVKLADGRTFRFEPERFRGNGTTPCVISMLGFIDTFVRLLPEDLRTKYKVPRGLPALSERRPVFKVLFALRGSADDLDISGADFYRLPNASIARDTVDPATGAVRCGEIGGSSSGDESKDEQDHSDTADQEALKTSGARRSKGQKIKFHSDVSWIHVSFPSAKDPSFEQRHGKVSTCVVTIEADDDFVTPFDTKPKLFVINKETAGTAGDLQRLLDRVTKDLISLYPQIEGKIVQSEVRGPFRCGLTHNPERFAAKGIRPESPYPGLYAGGSDLTVGDSFSGGLVGAWLVANSVIGYNALDLLWLKKTISSDVERFLEQPMLPEGGEDLAVPYENAATEEETKETSD